MATVTANVNDGRLFVAGPSGTSGGYIATNVGWRMAFDFVGTQVEMALNGFFNAYIDDPTRASPISINANQGNGLANTIVSGLTDGVNHTLEIVSATAGASQIVATGAGVRITGSSPSIASQSSLYPNSVAYKLGTGNIFGNQQQDLTHIRVDGALQPNPGNQGPDKVGSGTNCFGGSVTFYGNPASIQFHTYQGNFTGPGGFFVSIDNGSPVYYSSASNYNGAGTPGQVYTVLSGLDTTAVHKYELRNAFNASGVFLTDLILKGGTLNTTHTLPVRKKMVVYGDSITNDFATATDMTHPAPQDKYFDTTPGDRGFGAYHACISNDIALFINCNPSLALSALTNPSTVISNGFGNINVLNNADYVFLEPGVNNPGGSETTNFQANYSTLITNSLALFTSPTVAIWCMNILRNSVDDAGGSGAADYTTRRADIAAAVTAAANSKVILVNAFAWMGPASLNTIDGTHPNGTGNIANTAAISALLGVPVLVPATISLGPPNGSAITFAQNAAASGGVSPYSYQAQTSPAGANTWTNNGASSSTFPTSVSGLTVATQYDVRVVTTDSQPNSGNSNVITSYTNQNSGGTAGIKRISTSNLAGGI